MFRKAARCLEQLALPLKRTDTPGTALLGSGESAPTPRWVTPSPREAPGPPGLQRPWKAPGGGNTGLGKQQPDRGVGIHGEPRTAPRRVEGAGRRCLRADLSAVDGIRGFGWGRRRRPPQPAEPRSPVGNGARLPCASPASRRPPHLPLRPPPAHAQRGPRQPRPGVPPTAERGEPLGASLPRRPSGSPQPRRSSGSPQPRRSRASVPREIPTQFSLPCETAEPDTHFPSKAAL